MWLGSEALKTEDRCADIRPPTTLQYFYSSWIISQANYRLFVSFLSSRLLFQPFCGYFSDFCHHTAAAFLFAFVLTEIWARRNKARQEGKNTDERGVMAMNCLARFGLHSWATWKWNTALCACTSMLPTSHHMTPLVVIMAIKIEMSSWIMKSHS